MFDARACPALLGWLLILTGGAAGAQLTSGGSQSELLPGSRPNVLILLADDLGVDQLAVYREGADFPSTPHIDRLRRRGVLFRNVWANTLCTPTRGTIMTGRYGFRTGLGHLTNNTHQPLLLEELTLPEMLDLGTGSAYRHGAFGKWHLGNPSVGGPAAPNLAGWSHFDGVEENLFGLYDYFSYERITNGVVTPETGYVTSATVDWTLEWLRTVEEPWVAYVAFNAPHDPFHAPPAALHTVDLSGAPPPGVDARPYYKAMVEAMDTEIGRLLAGIEPVLDDTVVIFLGDNGTPPDVIVPPFYFWQGKTTLFEGGVNVPMIVSGPLVEEPGSECAALVNTTDLFGTVAEIAGVDLAQVVPADTQLDTVSIVPYLRDPSRPSIREWVFTELFTPNGPGPYDILHRAVRNDRYKYVDSSIHGEVLFDLWLDPFELLSKVPGSLSPAEQLELDELKGILTQLVATP